MLNAQTSLSGQSTDASIIIHCIKWQSGQSMHIGHEWKGEKVTSKPSLLATA